MRSGGTCCLPTPCGSFHVFCHSDRSMPFRREGYAEWRNLLFTCTLRCPRFSRALRARSVDSLRHPHEGQNSGREPPDTTIRINPGIFQITYPPKTNHLRDFVHTLKYSKVFLQEHFLKSVGPLCGSSSPPRRSASEALTKREAPTLVMKSGEGFDCFNPAWLSVVLVTVSAER
jgi:hypothetical protein